MLNLPANQSPLQFKQSTLVRKKLKHPIVFLQDSTPPSPYYHNHFDSLYKNQHAGLKSTKFSFRSSSILSINNNLLQAKSTSNLRTATGHSYLQKAETLQQKMGEIQALRRSVSARKMAIEERYSNLKQRSQELQQIYGMKARQVQAINESIDKYLI